MLFNLYSSLERQFHTYFVNCRGAQNVSIFVFWVRVQVLHPYHISVVPIGGAAEGELLLGREEAAPHNGVENDAAEDGDGGDDGCPDDLLDGEDKSEHQLRNDEARHDLLVDDGPHLHTAHSTAFLTCI